MRELERFVDPVPRRTYDGRFVPCPANTMTQSPSERRRHPRAALDWPVTLELPEGPCEARLRDVSRIGLCFFLDRPVTEMTVLSMQIVLPPPLPDSPGAQVNGSGVVVRCQPLSTLVDHYEIAVFLNDMDEEQRKRLDAFVETGTQV
jgi:hypothetical protein